MIHIRAVAIAAALLLQSSTYIVPELPPVLARADSSLAGTYLVSICKDKDKCSLGDTLVNGVFARLVLTDDSIRLDTLSESGRRELESSYIWLAREGPPNACYRSPGSGVDYEVELSHWVSPAPSRVHVALDRSTDSGWELDMDGTGRYRRRNGALLERQQSWTT